MGFQVCLRKPGLLPRFVQPERLHCGCSLPLIGSILGQDPPCSSWRKEKVYFSVSCGCGGRAGGRTQPQQRKQLGVAGAGGMEGRTPACELLGGGDSGLAVPGGGSQGEDGCERSPLSCGPRRLAWQTLPSWNAGLRPAWAPPKARPPATS